MDSNVSKNTNSHKFCKILLDQKKPTISLKKLLKQLLRSIYDLYQQQFNVQFEHKFVATVVEPEIVLANLKITQLSLRNNPGKILDEPQSTSIVYSCPFALTLASYCQISPQTVTHNLKTLIIPEPNSLLTESSLELRVEICSSGRLNFYLDSQNLATWLERSLFLIKERMIDEQDLSAVTTSPLDQTPAKLFPIQYTHARCCSLLRLGERSQLIALQGNFEQLRWSLKDSPPVTWLDDNGNCCLSTASEYELLRQLLMVADTFEGNPNYDEWAKLALSLSLKTAIFQADCRFLGNIQPPQKAIARLGLIALVQYWLQRILIEKLNLLAPIEL